MLNECNGCKYKRSLSHTDICTLDSPCQNQRNTLLTNDEWRRTCSAEEFAKFLKDFNPCDKCPARKICDTVLNCENSFLKWLKEKHLNGIQ